MQKNTIKKLAECMFIAGVGLGLAAIAGYGKVDWKELPLFAQSLAITSAATMFASLIPLQISKHRKD